MLKNLTNLELLMLIIYHLLQKTVLFHIHCHRVGQSQYSTSYGFHTPHGIFNLQKDKINFYTTDINVLYIYFYCF